MLHAGKLKNPSQNLDFAFLLVAAAAFSLWKCPFGCISDEAFYLTVPHRLSMGDALFWPRLLDDFYNAVMLPMIFVGLASYLLCRERMTTRKPSWKPPGSEDTL